MTYSRPNSLKRAALSTEIVGMAGEVRYAMRHKIWQRENFYVSGGRCIEYSERTVLPVHL